jgi:hypothetical protein
MFPSSFTTARHDTARVCAPKCYYATDRSPEAGVFAAVFRPEFKLGAAARNFRVAAVESHSAIIMMWELQAQSGKSLTEST